jgi:preprotein translocase subunit SecF
MQNIDFYAGKSYEFTPTNIDQQDPEYFSRIANLNQRQELKAKKRATRILSFIIALCIVSFTTGLAVGIKFAGGKQKEIVDKETIQAVSNIGNKMSHFITKNGKSNTSPATDVNERYPKKDYPFVIRIGNKYTLNQSKDIANYLSRKGHTIIISKHKQKYRVYTGPYKQQATAQKSLKEIQNYADNNWYSESIILNR